MQETADSIVKFVGIWMAAASTILVLCAPLVGLIVSACVAAGWLKADSGFAVFVAKMFPLSLHAQSGKPKLPPVGPAAILLLAIGAAATQVGCAGTFEEARLARHPAGAKTLTATAPLSDRCVKLSDRIRWEGATEVGGLALTGATGLSAIPIDGKTERIAIVSATTGIVVGTAIVHFLAESDRTAFVTECTQ